MPKQPIEIQRDEHDFDLNAKKVSMVSGSTIYAVVNTSAAAAGNTTVEQGTSPWVTSLTGNVTIDSGTVSVDSNTAWADPNTFIGLVTVTGDLNTTFTGNVTLDAGSLTGIVGNVTIDSGTVSVDSNTAWSDPNTYIGLATVDIGSSVTLTVDATGQGDVPVTLDGETVDVSDRAARDLGKVDIAAFDVALPAGDNNIGNVDVVSNTAWSDPNTYIGLATVDIGSEIVPSTLVNGMVSSASGSLVQFPANAVRWMTVKAAFGNATTCYVGDSNATINNGFHLDPGDSVGLAIDNTNKMYLVGVDDTEIRFVGGN